MSSKISEFGNKLKAIRRGLRDEYLQSHSKPWIIGFSGGKDSSLLAHLVVECILSVSPDERKRRVYVVSNDTLVESPIFQSFVDRVLQRMAESYGALQIPVEVVKTSPLLEESFWVNLLGRGYPAPKRMFRWCTDRMKIRPTTRFIREQVSQNGEVILLLGVRRAESGERAKNISKRETSDENSRLNPHSDLGGCMIYTPITELSTDEVWITLLNNKPPWGGDYRDLLQLYNHANGGECPFVVSDDDPASCGTSSARFGCWTCTVVEKDNSIEAMIDAGFEHLEPLADFRNRIKSISENPEYRSKLRRNGQPGLGPLTVQARRLLLEELLSVQGQTHMPLISDQEVRLIREQWAKDETESVIRDLTKLAEKCGNPGDF
jgi:DNA sulfur modification protein DndC